MQIHISNAILFLQWFFLVVMLVTEAMVSTISIIYMIILTAVFMLAVYEFAPMENPNKPLDENQNLLNRKSAFDCFSYYFIYFDCCLFYESENSYTYGNDFVQYSVSHVF